MKDELTNIEVQEESEKMKEKKRKREWRKDRAKGMTVEELKAIKENRNVDMIIYKTETLYHLLTIRNKESIEEIQQRPFCSSFISNHCGDKQIGGNHSMKEHRGQRCQVLKSSDFWSLNDKQKAKVIALKKMPEKQRLGTKTHYP